jgi:hypothetical protein
LLRVIEGCDIRADLAALRAGEQWIEVGEPEIVGSRSALTRVE